MGIAALCNLEHRGASGGRGEHRRRRRHHDPGPRPLPEGGRRLRPAARGRIRASGLRSCPTDGRRRRAGRLAASRRSSVERGPARPRMARGASRRLDARRWRPPGHAALPAAVHRRGARPATDRHRRSSGARSSCASASSTRCGDSRSTSRASRRRTFIYKGMLTTPQLSRVLPRPQRRAGGVGARARALALLHEHVPVVAARAPVPLHRAQRRDQHGPGQPQLDAGARGAARERSSPRRPRARIFPICTPGGSDTASFDEVLELLHLGGRSLPHAVLMMIPEAWENHESMSAEKRAFYRFHSSLMEPWDGPASIAFTDGTVDRRGARPQRPAPEPLLGHRRRPRDHGERGRRARHRSGRVVKKGRLQPGRMFLVDTSLGPHRRRRGDQGEPRGASIPTRSGCDGGLVHLDDLPDREHVIYGHESRACDGSRRSGTRTRS